MASEMGLMKDGPCEICGKRGNTTHILMHTRYVLMHCDDHTPEEIKNVCERLKQKWLETWRPQPKDEEANRIG